MICKSCKDYCLSGYIQVERSNHKEFYCYACTARLSTIKAERQKKRHEREERHRQEFINRLRAARNALASENER
jgi:hypothetical protein